MHTCAGPVALGVVGGGRRRGGRCPVPTAREGAEPCPAPPAEGLPVVPGLWGEPAWRDPRAGGLAWGWGRVRGSPVPSCARC